MRRGKLRELCWKIGGSAGQGIKVTGEILAKTMARGGWQILEWTEYPSLIKGGHNAVHLRIREEECVATEKEIDILVALNRETIDLHLPEMRHEGALIYDEGIFDHNLNLTRKDIRPYPLPIKKIALEVAGEELYQNTVVLGATVSLAGYKIEPLLLTISDVFADKGQEVIEKNIKAAKAGFEYVEKHPLSFSHQAPYLRSSDHPFIQSSDNLVLTGNEAIGLAALAGGCNFYSAYPMTPSTSILHFLAQHGPKNNMVVYQGEDEISVINSAIGASLSGARAMVGTSGGGFSLMVEALGLAGITETPLVIVSAQRPGPATGLPTLTGQGDLRFVLHASQDEFPRIILAPGSVGECFDLTWKALNLAEELQTPVFILTDAFISEGHQTVEKLQLGKVFISRGKLLTQFKGEIKGGEHFPRYKITSDGISRRPVPGIKNITFLANSDEHDEEGFSSDNAENRQKMMEKRMKKIHYDSSSLPSPKLFGHLKAKTAVISWGSSSGPARAAVDYLRAEGKSINFVHLPCLNPLPVSYLKKILSWSQKAVVVEGNYSGQLAHLIYEKTGAKIDKVVVKYDGRPFFWREVLQGIRDAI